MILLRTRARTTSAPVFFMREASSPTLISSGISTLVGAFLAISSCSFCIWARCSWRRLAPEAAVWGWRLSLRLANFSLPCLALASLSGTNLSSRSSYLAVFRVVPRVSMTRFWGTLLESLRSPWPWEGCFWPCWAWGCWASAAGWPCWACFSWGLPPWA